MCVLLAASIAAVPASASTLDGMFRGAVEEEVKTFYPDDAGGGVAEGESHSKKKAFLLSLMLPGLGQRYNESYGWSNAFFAVEAALWTTFIVYKTQEHYRADDYEEYAEAFANVSGGGKDEDYYRILTIYDNSDDYNMSVRIEARQLYDTREGQESYYAENAYGPDKSFQWRDDGNQFQFRIIRNDALNSGKRADYALSAAFINRAISAVQAARVAGRWKPVQQVLGHIRVDAPPGNDPALLRVGLSTGF